MRVLENIVKISAIMFIMDTTVWGQDIYVLRFSDTSTFVVTCGTIDSQWTVRNASCYLNSSIAIVPGDSLVNPPKQLTITVKTNHSGNLECADVAIIQHSVNNGSWITDSTLDGCISNSASTTNKTITVACQSAVRLKINLLTDSDNEFWQVKEAKITVNSGGGPLPIELISFAANTIYNNFIKLTWSTAAEINNDYFTIERSRNGIEYENLRQIKGSGNSTKVLDYAFIDENPLQSISYYRLKQTDFDGKYEYFHPISINFSNLSKASLSIYPNPVNSERNITIDFKEVTFETEAITISMIDVLGKENYLNVTLNRDNHFKISVNIDNTIAPGIYRIYGKGKNTFYEQSLIIQ